MKTVSSLLLLGLFAISVIPVMADTITLKNGSTIRCTVVDYRAGQFTVIVANRRAARGHRRTIHIEDIKSIGFGASRPSARTNKVSRSTVMNGNTRYDDRPTVSTASVPSWMARHNIIVRPGHKAVVNVTFNTDLRVRITIEDYLTGNRIKAFQSRPIEHGAPLDPVTSIGAGSWTSPNNETNQARVYVIYAERATFAWAPLPSTVVFANESDLNFLYGWQDREGGSYSSAAANISLIRED